MTNSVQTKTIHEFLADEPNVDRSELWAALWGILSEAKDKITAELDVTPYHSGAGLEYWTSEDGNYEAPSTRTPATRTTASSGWCTPGSATARPPSST